MNEKNPKRSINYDSNGINRDDRYVYISASCKLSLDYVLEIQKSM